MRDDFCIFVLTHGRAGRVYTTDTLRTFKYTGRIFYVVDDEDKQLDDYRKLYGDDLFVFSKQEVADRCDEGDNFGDRRSVFYARNACWEFARKVGVRYFMQCDDDYSGFYVRWSVEGRRHGSFRAEYLDDILEAMIEYFASIPALSIAMSQGGDHIGGTGASVSIRKAMNTFLCDVQRPFNFIGRVNEDVNTYVDAGRRGGLFLTIPVIQVNQKETQKNAGGMTELYRDSGTYVKSFYSVMYVPSAVRISTLSDPRCDTDKNTRVHHTIKWKHTTAQILDEKYRKVSAS